MTWSEQSLARVAAELRARALSLGAFNLVPVVLAPADAASFGSRLAAQLPGESFDFDAEAIAIMEENGWDTYVRLERAGAREPIRQALRLAAERAAARARRDAPLVVHGINLPVTYEFSELHNILYRASSRGLVALCIGGSVRGDRVKLHHRLVLAGGGLVQPLVLSEE